MTTLVGLLLTGTSLVTFDSASPGTIASTVAITGLSGAEIISDIDFRPATGQLYGLGSTNRLYTIDPITGVATAVAGPFTPALTTFNADIDFNPTVDRLRLVDADEQNLRLNPVTGQVVSTDTPLTNATATVGAAYDRNVVGTPATTLFVIDASTDTLGRQGGVDGTPSPNGGVITTIGSLGVNTNNFVGFDIDQSGAPYASLTVAGASNLYTIDLGTGAATLVGGIGAGLLLRDLAAQLSGSTISIAPGSNPSEVGPTPGTFNLTLSTPAPVGGLTVNYTVGGTATSGVDYSALSGSVFFAAGATTATINVLPVNDLIADPGETVTATVTAPSGYTISGSATASLTIIDAGSIVNSGGFSTIPSGGGFLILGNNLDNVIVGTSSNDTIYGYAGNDTILGNAGNDYIDGGSGNDSLLGGAGNDTLIGGAGFDTLIGANTTSTMPGLGEIDVLVGGADGDVFALADVARTYYLGGGNTDYALILGFGAGDTIQVRAADVPTIGGALPPGVVTGTSLYSGSDLIAVVQGIAPTFTLV